jgi:translation initiation factor 1
MSRPNKEKISIQGQSSGGLFAAFSGLEIPGLAPSPAPPSKEQEPPSEPVSSPPAKKGRVILRRETAHRGGKSVIVVDGFAPEIDAAALETLGKRLRAACGCGGSVKNRTLELQGNQPDRIRNWLEGEGFQVGGIR